MIEVNTSTEYWQKGASLVHTDPTGRRDAELPPTARAYMIAGTQHGGGPGTDPSPGPCVNPRNPHSASPALRALLVALEEWVKTGAAPPPSRVPSIAQGTAVAAETVEMPKVPGFALAPGANRIAAPVDWVDPPARLDNFYGTCVSAVDADGNEVAGIRLPPIAVPLGTYTGWNVYKAQPGELADRDGSLIPFARTKSEREAAGDPRPSLEERYGSRDAYVAKVKAAADALVADRLLLPADAADLCQSRKEMRSVLNGVFASGQDVLRSAQRLKLAQNRWNQFRHCRMDVHRPLQDRVGRLGVHHVEDRVDCLVAAGTEYRRAEDLLGIAVDQDPHEALGLALFDGARDPRHRALSDQHPPARLTAPPPRSCRPGPSGGSI